MTDATSTQPGVSVFLIARNEAERLPATLAALDWADQIVLVDSGSTDETVEIAKAAGAEVHHRDWTGYGPQKVFAEGLCRHDWVLNVDADEVVTPALAGEIKEVVGGPPAAFRVRILNVYPGDEMPRPFANDYNVVRLYHRSVAGYHDHPLFDRVALREKVPPGQLRSPIHHFPLTSFAHFLDKENRYTSYAAEAARPRSRWGLLVRLPVEMPLQFLKFYFLRRHLFGGWKGFMFALTAAFARTLRLAKMLERAESRENRPNNPVDRDSTRH
ncbi:MAG: glycosyltransferase family 2 protein [Pseudomonadota bacterium]